MKFREGAAEAGLDFQHVSGSPEKKYILESMSGGVALFDYDGDGWLDVYLVNGNRWDDLLKGTRSVRNALFRNRGDGTFEDVTARAGVEGGVWDMGAVAADIDNDGDRDLFVTSFGPNRLYRNRGDGTFEEIGQSAGVADPRWSAGAAFADYDGDGLIDLAVANYVQFDPHSPPQRTPLCRYRGIEVQCGPRGLPGLADILYRNKGNGLFEDVSQEAGIVTSSRYYGLGAAWADFDNDGDPDLLVANDSCPNFLFRNDSGSFTEVAMMSGIALSENGTEQAGMGVAFGDVDRDGWLDMVQTNFSDDKNTLYRNESGMFADASYRWNIGEVSWQYLGWGSLLLDADLDGFLDLFISNGHVYPQVERYQIGTAYKQREFLFHNQSGKRFQEAGEQAGFGELANSRGAAAGDFNNDGRLDIVVNRIDSAAALYWNETPTPGRHWIGFDLRGSASNRDAIGARITVGSAAGRQVAEVSAGGSYLSQSDRRVVFGLGSATPDRIEIRWPSGKIQLLENWKLEAYNKIAEPSFP
ncbi:MAG: CRTAC1 family protein [Acidobacteriota bacterium]